MTSRVRFQNRSTSNSSCSSRVVDEPIKIGELISIPVRLDDLPDSDEIVMINGQLRRHHRATVGVIITHSHSKMRGSMNDHATQHLAIGLSARFTTLCFNMRGVGKSTGDASWLGREEKHDIAATVRYMVKTIGMRRVYLVAYSFGGAIACSIAHLLRPVAGIVSISYPTCFSARFLVGHLMSGIRKFKKPKIFIVGDTDDWSEIPSLRNLIKTCTEPRKLINIRGADHGWEDYSNKLLKRTIEWLIETDDELVHKMKKKREEKKQRELELAGELKMETGSDAKDGPTDHIYEEGILDFVLDNNIWFYFLIALIILTFVIRWYIKAYKMTWIF